MKKEDNKTSENSNTQSCKNDNKSSNWFDSCEKPFAEEIIEVAKKGGGLGLPVDGKMVPLDKLCDPNCKLKDSATGKCPLDLIRLLEAADSVLPAMCVLDRLLNYPKCKMSEYYFETMMFGEHIDAEMKGEYRFSAAVVALLDPSKPLSYVKKVLEGAQQLGNKDAGELLKRLK